MQPPLPGMDPYLEKPSLFPDVHHRIITAICDHIQTQLVPRYVAQITPYIALEQIGIAATRHALVPDVGVSEHDFAALPHAGPSRSIATAPLVGTLALTVPTRYARIEIRAVADATLVTAIELLSPVNKRPTPDGAEAYEHKRRALFESNVHLLEIDLLRAGRRPQVFEPDPLPDVPYFVFLTRADRFPEIAIWPCPLHQPLPTVPVPLRAPDPDVALDLTQIIQHVYRTARYDVQVDYRADPPAPPLGPSDAAWLDARLRECGLRG